MNVPFSEHDWFIEQIATALAGGLSETEQARFDSHASECAACAAALAEMKNADAALAGVVSDLRPPDGLEDRIVGRLRSQRRILRIPGINHPMVIRAAVAAAAVIVVGTTGWVGTRYLEPQPKVATVQSNLRQQGLSIDLYGRSDEVLNSLKKRVDANGLNNRASDVHDSFALPTDGEREQSVPQILVAPTAAPTTYALNYTAFFPGQQLGNGADIPVLPGNAPVSVATAATGNSLEVNRGLGGGGGGGGASFDTRAYRLPGQLALGTEQQSPTAAPALAPAGDVRDRLLRSGQPAELAGGTLNAGVEPSAVNKEALALADSLSGKDQTPTPAPGAAASASPAQSEVNPTTQPAAMSDRKIIRSGTMKFEVENFDAADRRLRDIVRESGGYIGSADSTRQPNGKVQGTITIRVPPQNLDVLVLGLRALGDLQEQQIGAQDVTKEYTDLQSELRAAKAMEDRLLEIIKTGNGQVKDLLAVEKELGTWREKSEQVTGQINYYNNLVSLSTLTVTLSEKDINQAATATETETINSGLEADDVSKARDEVIKAVEAAKGRIIQSDLNEKEAGQFTATVVALLPADTGGPIIDRLRQLGRVTRLESNRRQTINGQPAPENVKVNKRDTQLQLSIYNVDAYAPRSSDNLSLACADVESAYHSILDFVNKSERARVIDSNLNRPTPDTTSGVISFEVREASADATLAFLRSLGSSLQFTVAENRNADNVTASKRGFNVTLMPLAGIAAQEADDVTVLPRNGDLLATYNALLDLANQPDVKARIVDKDLQQANGVYVAASISMEVPREKLDLTEQKIAAAGKVVARKANRQPDSANVIDSKVMLRFSFVNVDVLEPRQTFVRNLAAADAPAAYQAILEIARAAGAKVRSADLHVEPGQTTMGQLEFDLPLEKQAVVQDALDHATSLIGQSTVRAAEGDATTESKVRYRLTVYQTDQLTPRRLFTMEIQTPRAESAATDVTTAALAAGGQVLEHSTRTEPDGRGVTRLVLVAPLDQSSTIAAAARNAGVLIKDQSVENSQAPGGPAARARLEIEFNTEAGVVADNDGLFASIKQGLTTSVRALLWSVRILVMGLGLVVPFVVVLWGGWKTWKWARRTGKDATE